MTWLRIFLYRLRGLFLNRKLERDLADEIHHHLEMQVADFERLGMSRDEARSRALRNFGGVEQVKETYRDRRTLRGVEATVQDLRYGLRVFRRSPGFTAVAVLSLGLGIGANTALFSVVDAVLLRTLPVKEPERLALFEWQAGRPFRVNGWSGTSYVPSPPDTEGNSLFRYEVFDRMRQARAAEEPDGPLSDFFAFAPTRELTAVAGDQAERIRGQAVSGGYFAGLGVQPILGRPITDQDDQPDATPVVVLSHQYWQERFGASPGIIGNELKLNQYSFTIIGVTPPEFTGTLQVGFRPTVTVPLVCETLLSSGHSRMATAKEPGAWWLDLMGRLKPGATFEEARDSLNAAFQATALEIMPPPHKAKEPAQIEPKDYPRLIVESGSRGMLDRRRLYSGTIYGLFIVVALVLLIACANVANLLLARAATRSAEISMRLAVGAGRRRLVRQLLTESVLLAGLGGAVGVVFAFWGKHALLALTDKNTAFLPTGLDLSLNLRVLGFTLAVSLLTGVLFGLAPACRTTGLDLATSMKQSRRTTGAVSRLSKGLIVVQVAVSLLLLVGAGLFIRTLYNLQRVNLGFNEENLLIFGLQPKQSGYKDEQLVQFYRQLFDRLDNLPGVRAATFARVPLIADDNYVEEILLPGESELTAARHDTNRQIARENYLATMEIPLLSGRGFTPQDDQHAPGVAIVNQAFARVFFPEDDALGKHVTLTVDQREVEIIGVVADTKYMSQREELKPLLYTPWHQEGAHIGDMNFALRTAGPPSALAGTVRQVVRELDSNLPVTELGTQTARSEATLGQERLFARLLTFFGLVALVLAAIGLSGVLAYSVAQRTNEIGIRMALGAEIGKVLSLVIWQGMKLVLLGLVIGAAGGYAVKRLIGSEHVTAADWQRQIAEQLYGVSSTDPWTFSVIAVLLTLVALVACYVPGRRASRVDPITALRYE